MNHHSKIWPLQEAKAKFSELVRRAQNEGPQTVTVHGQVAVVVTAANKPGLDFKGKTGADFVAALRKGPLFDFALPPRPTFLPEKDFSFDDDDEKS